MSNQVLDQGLRLITSFPAGVSKICAKARKDGSVTACANDSLTDNGSKRFALKRERAGPLLLRRMIV